MQVPELWHGQPREVVEAPPWSPSDVVLSTQLWVSLLEQADPEVASNPNHSEILRSKLIFCSDVLLLKLLIEVVC